MPLHIVSDDWGPDWELGDEDDQNEPEQSSYDISKYYIRASDSNGNSGPSQRFWLPPHESTAIDVILRRNPNYSTPRDFYRNWVYHGIHYEHHQRGHDIRLQQALETEARLVAQDQYLNELSTRQQIDENYKTLFESALALRDYGLLASAVECARRDVPTLEEPWRSKLEKRIAKLDAKLARGAHVPSANQ